MNGSNQHFVPQFYLRNFSCDGKRIGTFILEKGLLISEAGVRGQCARHRFYGEDPGIEPGLARLESLAAPILRQIIDTNSAPASLSRDHEALLTFIAAQIARTGMAQREMNAQLDLLMKEAPRGKAPFQDSEPDQAQVRLRDSGQMLVGVIDRSTSLMRDLDLRLVAASGAERFVTSDNPAIRYNRFREGIDAPGGIGFGSMGFQIFFPISPEKLLVLFDSGVYVPRKTGSAMVATDDDVRALNRVQAVFAEECLYFREARREDLLVLSRSARELRKERRAVLKRFAPDVQARANVRSELLVFHMVTPDLRLRTSFLGVRKSAERIKLGDRLRERLREPPRGPTRRLSLIAEKSSSVLPE